MCVGERHQHSYEGSYLHRISDPNSVDLMSWGRPPPTPHPPPKRGAPLHHTHPQPPTPVHLHPRTWWLIAPLSSSGVTGALQPASPQPRAHTHTRLDESTYSCGWGCGGGGGGGGPGGGGKGGKIGGPGGGSGDPEPPAKALVHDTGAARGAGGVVRRCTCTEEGSHSLTHALTHARTGCGSVQSPRAATGSPAGRLLHGPLYGLGREQGTSTLRMQVARRPYAASVERPRLETDTNLRRGTHGIGSMGGWVDGCGVEVRECGRAGEGGVCAAACGVCVRVG